MACLMDEENNSAGETDSPEDFPYVDFVCGDPQSDPRVGDEYQVEIPPMMTESERAAFLNPTDSEVISGTSLSFLVGLPIQITWINSGTSKGGDEQRIDDETIDINESLKSLKAKRNRSIAKNRAQSQENSEPRVTENKKNLNLEAIPGLSASCWEDNDVESFLLGLYTFGKNFVRVKEFMESKEMGEILSFYYGKFYKSCKYRNWSDSRKKRNRKCVFGRKLFSGWRQQELLSRLIPCVTDDSQKDQLLDVSKSFAEGNVSLENYMSSLKSIVGLRALVNAVAIGKDKKDLTVLAMEPIKSKQWFTISSKAGAGGGGVYASLTSNDIIKELTGGSRLSKARCNDIFWEAVWPRLLARGWHSEQPKDRGYVTSKDYLVFLVPGVRKFSRRKLVKGDHYFDSVSDILTKVASEPDLLELKAGEIKANGFEGKGEEDSSESSDQGSPSDKQRQRYLRSPGLNRGSVRLKFTVVDTSLAIGGKLCDLRELRTMPMESPFVSKSTSHGANKDHALEGSPDNSKLEKACEMPLNVQNNNKVADERRRERNRMHLVDDSMRFTIVDTSLDHGGKSSGMRKRRHLPVDEHQSRIMNTIDDSSDEYEDTQDGVDANTKPDREKSAEKKKKKKMGSSGSPQESRRCSDSNPKQKTLEKNRNEKATEEGMNDDRSHKAIKRKFIRRSEANRTALLKRRRLSACVRTELSQSRENFMVKPPESDQTSLFYPPSIQNETTEAYSQDLDHENGSVGGKNEKKAETQFSADMNSKTDSHKETKTGDGSIGAKNIEKDETRFSIDMNSDTGDPEETEDGQCSPMEIQEGQEIKPNECCLVSVAENDSSRELGATHEIESSENQRQWQQMQQQQLNSDVPRRQSTRKRPLTTRVLEALESGFFSTTKRRTSPKPRKRVSGLKKNDSTKAHNKVRVISEDENAESRILDRDLKDERREERNFLVKKATTSKPLDQIEDTKPMPISEVPRLPPIVLKLSFKRG